MTRAPSGHIEQLPSGSWRAKVHAGKDPLTGREIRFRKTRTTEVEAQIELRRAAQYRPTMVDPYRDYLRKRRSEEPGVPVQQLLREIRELGYPGSSNLLVRYLNQGRADAPRSHLSPRKAARLLLSKPDNLNDSQRETAARLSSSCPEMKALASLIGSFAALLAPDPANEEKLVRWIADARAADLPNLHSFTRGLDLDIKAATAAFTLPHHNGRTEGVNTKTKMLKRQMFGRAGFELLRHRILLGLGHGTPPPELRQSL
jgi:transposase